MQDQINQGSATRETDDAVQGRPWWKACMIGCAGLFLITIIAGFIFGNMVFGTGTKQLNAIPDQFPKELVLYRPEEIKRIEQYPAAVKGRLFQVMLAPLKVFGTVSKDESLQALLKQSDSIAGSSDIVSVMWTGLNASEDEVLRFYAGSLKQAGVPNPEIRKTPEGDSVEMIGSSNTLKFSLLLLKDPKKDVIDTLTIIVEYPSTK